MRTLASPVSPRNSVLWIVVTVRVAWEFVNAGIRLTPAVLDEAREHVLRSMPVEGLDSDRAELLARAYVCEYIRRVRFSDYSRVPELEDIDVLVPRGWGTRIEQCVTQVEEAVYRLHYGDSLSLEEIIRRYPRLDMAKLIAAREGIRELARSFAVEDEHVSLGWAEGRLDRLLCRVASRPQGSCPSPHDLFKPTGLDHADRCSACSRAVRLVRAGVLQPEDLIPDPTREPEPGAQEGVFAFLLHPDARRHRKRLLRALGSVANSVGPDAWLVSERDLEHVRPVLHVLCEESSPHRHHLRGALVRGPGRWSRGVLLGPVAVQALDAARARTWADMGTVCQLPKALPPPPRATLWWATAVLSGLAVFGTWQWTNQSQPVAPDMPVDASFMPLDAGWKIRFDTSDLATVNVVVLEHGVMRVFREDVLAGKGAWSTGEGDYVLHAPGERVLLISSPESIEDLPSLLVAASDRRDPLAELAEEVAESHPEADIQLSDRAGRGLSENQSQARVRP